MPSEGTAQSYGELTPDSSCPIQGRPTLHNYTYCKTSYIRVDKNVLANNIHSELFDFATI